MLVSCSRQIGITGNYPGYGQKAFGPAPHLTLDHSVFDCRGCAVTAHKNKERRSRNKRQREFTAATDNREED